MISLAREHGHPSSYGDALSRELRPLRADPPDRPELIQQNYSEHHQKKQKEQPEDSDDIVLLDTSLVEKQPRPKRESHKPPNFHVGLSKKLVGVNVAQLLEEYIPLYSSNLPRYVAKEIERARKVIEEHVYNSETATPSDYLRFVYHNQVNVAPVDRTGLEEIMAAKLASVQRSIESGGMEVHQKKKDSMDISRLLRLKEGEIKSKLADLRDNMSSSMFAESILMDKSEELDPNYFDRNSERTKQAEQFVRRMNEKQEQIRKHFEELKLKEKLAKEQAEKEREFQRQEMNSLKHIKVKERHERRRELRRKEEEQKQKQFKEFQQFVAEYKLRKPLYKRKEEAFSENFLLPEYEKYRMRLDQIKEAHAPISAEQLQEHERKYMQIKSEYETRREQEYKLKRNQEHRKRNSEYYRGKFHTIVMRSILAQKTVEDPKDELRVKRFKQQAYSDHIKVKFVPKVDLKKKKEMEEIIESSLPPRKRMRLARKEPLLDGERAKDLNEMEEHEPDPKLDGKRNMEAVRRMIENYRRQGKIKVKKQSEEKRAVSVSLEPRPDYLKQLRQQRATLVNTSRQEGSTDLQPIQLADVDSYQRARLRAALIDEHAERRERYMRHNRHQPVSALEEGSKLEDDYLASIRAKLSILQAHQHPGSP